MCASLESLTRERDAARTKGDVACALGRVEVGEVPQLERGFADRVEDLGGGLTTGPAAGVDKLLQKDLAEDAVGLFLKDGGEDDGDAVGRGQEVDGLFGAVVDAHDLGPGVFRGRALGVGLGLDLALQVKGALKGGGEGVALQERDGVDQVAAGVRLGGGVSRQSGVVEVDLEGDAVALLGAVLGQEAVLVLAFEDVAGAVVVEFGPAGDVHREEQEGLAVGGREVVADRVKVDKGLVERRGAAGGRAVG